jgi:ParB-like chromosome segregation protein Spo0J
MIDPDRRQLPSAPKLEMASDYNNLEAHPLANEYPMADDHEFAGLKESIRRAGIRVPIKLYRGLPNGQQGPLAIIDGRNRYKAAKEAGHKLKSADFEEFVGSYAEAEVYVDDTNRRRHMTPEQKQERAKKLIEKHPNYSTRRLAEMVGVSHTTIANLRKPASKDDKGLETLIRGWQNANYDQQERFVEMFKIDLAEILRPSIKA